MQQVGEFIVERKLPDILRSVCLQHGISCRFFSDDWMARLERAGKVAWVCGYKFDINSSAAAMIAQDKVATYCALQYTGIKAVPHVLARTYGTPLLPPHVLTEQLSTSGPVVIKPLSGTGARGVELCDSVEEAVEKIEANPELPWTISPYLELVSETRLIVLDDRVLLAYEKHNPVEQNGLKLFNLGRGATAVTVPAREPLAALARTARAALSLRVAAVDIVTTADGQDLVLEINDGMMMENYTRQSPDNARRAETVYDAVITAMMA